MKKYFCVFSFAIACALASIPAFAMDYSSRKFNNGLEANPMSSVIVNADCVFEDGKFIMKSLPSNLPELFTIRFTAPEDFTQGNTIVVSGIEMPLRVPSMINASSAIFRAGAVFHIDIDMDRQMAFAWGNQGGGQTGSLPNLSYSEQFSGSLDEEGDKIYFKSVNLGFLGKNQVKKVAHNIVNLKSVIDIKARWRDPYSSAPNMSHMVGTYIGSTSNWQSFWVVGGEIWAHTSNYDRTKFSAIVTLAYTCTDR